jgi:hypothetical protein
MVGTVAIVLFQQQHAQNREINGHTSNDRNTIETISTATARAKRETKPTITSKPNPMVEIYAPDSRNARNSTPNAERQVGQHVDARGIE